MAQVKPRQRLWCWRIGAFLLFGAIVAVRLVSMAPYVVGNAIGRTTVVEDPDGTEKTIYWRDHPGTAELDPQEILRGPTPERGFATGQKMIAQIKTALTEEFQLEWAPEEDAGDGPFYRPVQNYFGGDSLLTIVNGPSHQSTAVPQAWADKQRAISIIGEVTSRYGYEAPTLESLDGWTDEDLVRDLGGLTQEEQVTVSRNARGPAGQWLDFNFQVLTKDKEGRFEEKFRSPEGKNWQMNTISLSYGANGLLAEEDREAFKSRLEPFLELAPPPPLES
ncbi:hypothetical protein [Paeniglutamicibacter sp. NPDC091659]|uniref:hypothetical protein n=1 Tax=Paeniglutamicibacter sp. NPDC091659 TaxID=3364389 RepID=UPI0038153531